LQNQLLGTFIQDIFKATDEFMALRFTAIGVLLAVNSADDSACLTADNFWNGGNN
jgi:hypothetical protein